MYMLNLYKLKHTVQASILESFEISQCVLAIILCFQLRFQEFIVRELDAILFTITQLLIAYILFYEESY